MNTRWIALIALCLGTLMIVLDTTIVNVALPSIRTSLGFSETSLAWVVNAYVLTFGGFLMLGGRLGDLFGPRRLFLLGLILFTFASLLCGFASTQWFLIVARALQGVGGAIVSAVSLSLMMNLFTEPGERAKAMGYFGFVAAGGGSVGVLLGGVLTGALNWHWIFWVNIPIGIGVFLLAAKVLPHIHEKPEKIHLDIVGAGTITLSLILAVYGIVSSSDVGWTAFSVLGSIGAAIVLFIIFLVNESKVTAPLIPLDLFRIRNLTVANIVGVLWSAAMFAWFFMSALYMQVILGYSPLQVGLAFLPANLIMAVFSFSLSAKLINRFGTKRPLAIGLAIAALGLFLLGFAPVSGGFLLHLLPSMILLGIGAGIAFNPVLLIAMSDVAPEESGIASGIVNTAFMMGGALGLAILANIAASRAHSLLSSGTEHLVALTSGYHAAFFVGAVCAGLGGLLSAVLLKTSK